MTAVRYQQPEIEPLDRFYDIPYNDTSIQSIERVDILDSNTQSAERNNPKQLKVKFDIKKSEDIIDYHYDAGIRLRGKVVKKSDGTDLPAGSYNDVLGVTAAPFARTELKMVGNSVELNTDPFTRACFQDHLEHRLTEYDVRDQSNYFPETDVTEFNGRLGGIGYNADGNYPSVNDVYVQKLQRRNGVSRKYPSAKDYVATVTPSGEIEMFIPLRYLFSYFRDNIYPISSTMVSIELELTEENVIKGFKQAAAAGANTQEDCLFRTTYIRLELSKWNLSDEYQKLLIEGKIEGKPVIRAWKKYDTDVITGGLQGTQGTLSTQLGSYTTLPDKVYIAVRSKQKAQKLNQLFNYSTFDMLKFKELRLKIQNSVLFPASDWEYDIENRHVIQLYNEWIAAQHKYSNEDSGLMPINVWLQNYPIICFDLSKIKGTIKTASNYEIYIQCKWDSTPVVHPYATMQGEEIVFDAAEPAIEQQYQFYKHVEIPCAMSVDLTTGTMLVNTLIN